MILLSPSPLGGSLDALVVKIFGGRQGFLMISLKAPSPLRPEGGLLYI